MSTASFNVPVLAYHKVKDKFELGINSLSVSAFEKQIQYLHKLGYYTTSLINLTNNKIEPGNYHPLIITFDDGDESIFKNVFPILNKFGFKATVFIISDFVGKYNTWDHNLFGNKAKHLTWKQIKILSQHGWEIGSHAATHRDLTRLSEDEAFFELIDSQKKISELIEKPVEYISYPFNKLNDNIIQFSQQAGYKGCCILSDRKNYKNKFGEYVIPRMGVYSIDSLNSLNNKLSNSAFESVKQHIISFFSQGTIYYKQLKK